MHIKMLFLQKDKEITKALELSFRCEDACIDFLWKSGLTLIIYIVEEKLFHFSCLLCLKRFHYNSLSLFLSVAISLMLMIVSVAITLMIMIVFPGVCSGCQWHCHTGTFFSWGEKRNFDLKKWKMPQVVTYTRNNGHH